MFRPISRQELQAQLKSQTPVALVEALPEKHYRDGHLPGALHLPHDKVRELASQVLPDKNAVIVAYCANAPCQNSRIAAQTLDSLGYTNVFEYVDGKQDWIDAGLPLEKGATATAVT
ncbi:MAG: rhodanese-like domain-containing protein [Gammaproteobacteria bacterium]|nr:rhodanese-like domain-containing protein [Gammaproteobacteria bacterium]